MNINYDIELVYNKTSVYEDYFTEINAKSSIRFLKNTNSINIFVGANNSGKSRFLRALINHSNIKGVNDVEDIFEKIEEYNSIIRKFNFKIRLQSFAVKQLEKYSTNKNIKFANQELFFLNLIDVNYNLNKLKTTIDAELLTFQKVSAVFNYACNINDHISDFLRSIYINDNKEDKFFFESEIVHLKKVYPIIIALSKQLEIIRKYSEKKIYIPTLRTAHSLFIKDKKDESTLLDIPVKRKKLKEDIFLETIKKNYSDLKSRVDIFTGLNLYYEIVNVRNSIKEERTKFHEFETFLSKNFFNGNDIDIVAKFNINENDLGDDSDNLIKVYINGKSKELYNLGDGIQSLIILMYKIFLAEDESLIFIDEPELNLHPGYQRLFLEQLTANPDLLKKNLTYFMVTHSNHLLDLTIEKDNISIYSFSSFREDKFLIRNVNAGDNEILRSLGVNNSSVFLANCSIWVEGISDRNFIKAFLKAYCKHNKEKELREDIDFAFFEYAGSNLTHYNFNKKTKESEEIETLITSYALNNRIFLLSDLDSGKETKHNNIKEIADATDGFNYLTTKPYRELENLLSNEIWRKILIEFCNKNKVKEDENKIQEKIDVALNKIKTESYKTKYVGEFLKDLNLKDLNKIWEEGDKGNPKTFKYKTDLSLLLLKKVEKGEITWNHFSQNQTIINITESVYQFIFGS